MHINGELWAFTAGIAPVMVATEAGRDASLSTAPVLVATEAGVDASLSNASVGDSSSLDARKGVVGRGGRSSTVLSKALHWNGVFSRLTEW